MFQAFFLKLKILFFGSQFFAHTRYKEIPINKNNTVHMGPKIQFGGLKLGLFKALYQAPIFGAVKTEPKTPADSQIIMLINNLTAFTNFIKYLLITNYYEYTKVIVYSNIHTLLNLYV